MLTLLIDCCFCISDKASISNEVKDYLVVDLLL